MYFFTRDSESGLEKYKKSNVNDVPSIKPSDLPLDFCLNHLKQLMNSLEKLQIGIYWKLKLTEKNKFN